MTIGRYILIISLIIFGGLRVSPIKPIIFKYTGINPNKTLSSSLVIFCYCLIIGLIASS